MCDILASSLFWCSKINSLQLVLLWMVINIHIKLMACNFVQKKPRNAFQWFSCNIRIHCHCLITLTKAVFLTWLMTCSTYLNIYILYRYSCSHHGYWYLDSNMNSSNVHYTTILKVLLHISVFDIGSHYIKSFFIFQEINVM